MATLNDFANFDLSKSLDQENTVTDFLAENFNGGRMKYSAGIGAVAGATGSSLTATLGGAMNGYMNSDSDNFFGKVVDGFKGMLEAQAVMRVIDMLPENTKNIAALLIGGAGLMYGNHLQNVKENNDILIESQAAANPAVDIMRGMGRDNLLDAARDSVKDGYEHIKDPEVKQYFKMT